MFVLDVCSQLILEGLTSLGYGGPSITLYEAQQFLFSKGIYVLPALGVRTQNGHRFRCYVYSDGFETCVDNDREDYETYSEALQKGLEYAVEKFKSR